MPEDHLECIQWLASGLVKRLESQCVRGYESLFVMQSGAADTAGATSGTQWNSHIPYAVRANTSLPVLYRVMPSRLV
jgi:hypothetical protein